MKSKIEIEQEVNKTYEFLNSKEEIKSNPFFLTKLQTKLEDEINKINKHNFLFLLKYRFNYALIIIFLINLISLIFYFSSSNETSYNRNQNISEIINEYKLNQFYSNESSISNY